jgi:ABC-2 type transport system ATP-binding protein
MPTKDHTDVPLLRVENLSHRYSSQWAVKNVSFELNNNAIIGLLGSNGAGKSTMMNIICGVLTQTQGKVTINGYDNITDRLEAKRHIGFLPQKPPLHLDLTVEEYLRYTAHLRLIKRSQVKAAVADVMKKCGITHFRNRLIKNLSGGYQQRVGIAQAIIHNPKFIVLDEPTNGLDPNQILEIRNLIKEIAKNRIVWLSTHILQEVRAMCHHIHMVEEGEFVFNGSIKDFNNSVLPHSLIAILSNPPSDEELNKIEGVKSVELTDTNTFRFFFEPSDNLQERIVQQSVNQGWQLQEIYKEKIEPDEIFKFFSNGSIKKEPLEMPKAT